MRSDVLTMIAMQHDGTGRSRPGADGQARCKAIARRRPSLRKTDARRHEPSNRDIKRISVALAENFIVSRCRSVMQIHEATEAVSAHRATTSGPRRVFPLDHNTIGRISLAEGAVATSQPSGTVFEPTGRLQHLFDPRALPVLQLSYHQSGITIKLFENTELTCNGMGNSGPAARLDRALHRRGALRACLAEVLAARARPAQSPVRP